MSGSLAILPIQGVPDELLRVLNDRFRQLGLDTPQAATGSVAGLVFTHATRASVNLTALGTFAAETDRGVVYQVRTAGSSKVWAYAAGMMKATFANQPTDLGGNDTGFLWYVSDYAHTLRWTGTGWEFVDGMGGRIEGRVVAPDGNGWQLCDGSATHYLHIAAGVVSEVAFTTPNLTGTAAYQKWAAAYTGTIVAANAPTAGTTNNTTTTGSAARVTSINADGEPSHLNMLPYFRR